MKTEQWRQLDELFHLALEREPAERRAFLDQACAGDESLRQQVDALLAANEKVGSFIERPAMELEAQQVAFDEEPYLADLVNGELIGHYSIIAPLGVGGMGEVYLAHDISLRRKVALKLLSAEFTRDRDRVRRFQQEARAASALNHPNIITIYEIGQIEDRHFIATEYIDGETLRKFIRGSQSPIAADGDRIAGAGLQLRDVLSIGMQVADALAAAHDKGIVHRDIKPDNIMLVKDLMQKETFVKVLDFGIAKLTEQGISEQEATTKVLLNTHEGSVIGTAGYMSPEQARGEKVDGRTDIWSLGIVLYEMLTNSMPFAGATAPDFIASILKEEPPQLSSGFPDRLRSILSKALRKNREERYQTISEMFSDLADLQRQESLGRPVEDLVLPKADPERVTFPAELNSGKVAEVSNEDLARQTRSSAEYLAGEVKQHKLAAALILMTLLLAIAGGAYFFYLAKSEKRGISSIAVLPFTNVSNNPDTEYLSDGVSESLINSLSKLPGVKVIARSSSFKYKGKEFDPQEVARSLSVEAILTGRVTQRGDNLLISVELVDARDKTQVWGEQYNRRAVDVLQVQSEISREISEKLRLHLTAGEQQQLGKRESVNPQAYELLLKGRFYWRKQGLENQKQALEYYQQAISVDPTYALAYVELAAGYSVLYGSGNLDPKEFKPKAEAAVHKALELDERLADAHYVLANLKQYAWEWAAAEREYQRAIELNPNLAEAHLFYSFYLMIVGRNDEAITEAKRSRELDPLSLWKSAHIAICLTVARRYDEAIELSRETLEMDQNFASAHFSLAGAYAGKGMYREAIAESEEAIKLGGDTPTDQIYLGKYYAKAGERGKAQAILKRLQTTKEYVSKAELAVLYVALGEREQALASLEKAYAEHDLQLQSLRADNSFDSLRGDPRFQDLLRRVGLTP